jgi:hypothetical protein
MISLQRLLKIEQALNLQLIELIKLSRSASLKLFILSYYPSVNVFDFKAEVDKGIPASKIIVAGFSQGGALGISNYSY